MKNYDTIAAIATGTTNAGISIIRVSGTNAFSIADSIFVSKKKEKKLDEGRRKKEGKKESRKRRNTKYELKYENYQQ